MIHALASCTRLSLRVLNCELIVFLFKYLANAHCRVINIDSDAVDFLRQVLVLYPDREPTGIMLGGVVDDQTAIAFVFTADHYRHSLAIPLNYTQQCLSLAEPLASFLVSEMVPNIADMLADGHNVAGTSEDLDEINACHSQAVAHIKAITQILQHGLSKPRGAGLHIGSNCASLKNQTETIQATVTSIQAGMDSAGIDLSALALEDSRIIRFRNFTQDVLERYRLEFSQDTPVKQ